MEAKALGKSTWRKAGEARGKSPVLEASETGKPGLSCLGLSVELHQTKHVWPGVCSCCSCCCWSAWRGSWCSTCCHHTVQVRHGDLLERFSKFNLSKEKEILTGTCLARSIAVATCCWCSWLRNGSTCPMIADIRFTISVWIENHN